MSFPWSPQCCRTLGVEAHVWRRQVSFDSLSGTSRIPFHLFPVVLQLQNPTRYITQDQYPLSLQSLRGLKPIISDLLRKKHLYSTSSHFNTLILAVKKSIGTYCLVQYLQLLNYAMVLFSVMANSYILLSTVPSGTFHFSVLDLKDTQ